MSVLSLSYWESDVYWRQNNKHFAELAPQNGGKQLIWRNYVTVTLCIGTSPKWLHQVREVSRDWNLSAKRYTCQPYSANGVSHVVGEHDKCSDNSADVAPLQGQGHRLQRAPARRHGPRCPAAGQLRVLLYTGLRSLTAWSLTTRPDAGCGKGFLRRSGERKSPMRSRVKAPAAGGSGTKLRRSWWSFANYTAVMYFKRKQKSIGNLAL